MIFTIKIEPEARHDIQGGIEWYNEQQTGLGRKFHIALKAGIKKLQTNPFYQVRFRHHFPDALPTTKFLGEKCRLKRLFMLMNLWRDPFLGDLGRYGDIFVMAGSS